MSWYRWVGLVQLVVGGAAGVTEKQDAVVAMDCHVRSWLKWGLRIFRRGLSWMWVPRMTHHLLIHELDCW